MRRGLKTICCLLLGGRPERHRLLTLLKGLRGELRLRAVVEVWAEGGAGDWEPLSPTLALGVLGGRQSPFFKKKKEYLR